MPWIPLGIPDGGDGLQLYTLDRGGGVRRIGREDQTYYPMLGRAKVCRSAGSAPQARPHFFPLPELVGEVDAGAAEEDVVEGAGVDGAGV